MATGGDRTWTQLLNWTKGQKISERLSVHAARIEGFESLDPSHPLGGKDGGIDAIATKDGKRYSVAVYFPRGQQNFKKIKEKFIHDLQGANKIGVEAIAFFTNQEMSLSERKELINIAAQIHCELYHLERLSNVLDSPQAYGIRLEFMDIEMTKEEQLSFFSWLNAHIQEQLIIQRSIKSNTDKNLSISESLLQSISGGNSFPEMSILTLSGDSSNIVHFWGVHNNGDYPLEDVTITVSNQKEVKEKLKNSNGLVSLADFSDRKVYRIGNITPNMTRPFGEPFNINKEEELYFSFYTTTKNKAFSQLYKFIKSGNRHISATIINTVVATGKGKSEILKNHADTDFPGQRDGEIVWEDKMPKSQR